MVPATPPSTGTSIALPLGGPIGITDLVISRFQNLVIVPGFFRIDLSSPLLLKREGEKLRSLFKLGGGEFK
jgi:hypothetical protein